MEKGLKRHKCTRTEKGGRDDGIKETWTPFWALLEGREMEELGETAEPYVSAEETP